MHTQQIQKYLGIYRDGLLHDTLPFWTERAHDPVHGGFSFFLDRKGERYDTDKGVWQNGRFTWMLATLYNDLEANPRWYELAGSGIRFLTEHGFDADGRMFFHLNQQGLPIRKRRYVFSETFTIIALAAWAKASGEDWAARRAHELWEFVMELLHKPGALPAKFTANRHMKGLALPMILLVTAQELRKNLGDQGYTETITKLIGKIKSDWMKPEFKAVLENVGPDGSFLNHADGRIMNPGHAIEAAWFILDEAEYRGDEEMKQTGLTILDWMWEWGWDKEFGGILYYRDVLNHPVVEYWHDMKFWWPHNEAIIATLKAYRITGDEKYAEWHRLVHEWAYKHFADPEYGEWFGYLRRDGSISSSLKGNLWKGPFHLPRMQWIAWQECEKLIKAQHA